MQTTLCKNRNCRPTYGYNYRWEGSSKVNKYKPEDLDDGVFFVNSKTAFTIRYIKYQASLVFRGGLSTEAAAWAYMDAMGAAPLVDFNKVKGVP